MNKREQIAAIKKKVMGSPKRTGCPNCNKRTSVFYHYEAGKSKDDEDEYRCDDCGCNWIIKTKQVVTSVKVINCGDK